MLTINPDTLTDTQAEAAINYILTLRPDCLGADEDSNKGWTQKTFTAPVTSGQSTPVVNEAPEHLENPEGAPDFDSAGLPWDERIHASSKATVADGTWRKKRGVDDATVAAVEAELRNLAATNEDLIEQAAPLDTPEVPEAPPSPADDVDNADYSDAPGTDAPPAPPVDAPAPEAPANPFLAIMKRVTAAQTAGKFPKEKRDELLAAAGVDSIIKLNNNPDAIATFSALLDAEGL